MKLALRLAGSRIQDETKSCKELFDECDAHPAFHWQEWLFSPKAEFNLWSTFANASCSDESSLDYKVRWHRKLRGRIIIHLSNVHKNLERCLSPGVVIPLQAKGDNYIYKEGDIAALDCAIYWITGSVKYLGELRHQMREADEKRQRRQPRDIPKSVSQKTITELREIEKNGIGSILTCVKRRNRKNELPKSRENSNTQLIEPFVREPMALRDTEHEKTQSLQSQGETMKPAEIVDLENGAAAIAAISPGPQVGEETSRKKASQDAELGRVRKESSGDKDTDSLIDMKSETSGAIRLRRYTIMRVWIVPVC
ncbi:hypothetical protein V8C35DRAFT_295729 [Trichoderma chlorosporum]